jgi:hypothetical protein
VWSPQLREGNPEIGRGVEQDRDIAAEALHAVSHAPGVR